MLLFQYENQRQKNLWFALVCCHSCCHCVNRHACVLFLSVSSRSWSRFRAGNHSQKPNKTSVFKQNVNLKTVNIGFYCKNMLFTKYLIWNSVLLCDRSLKILPCIDGWAAYFFFWATKQSLLSPFFLLLLFWTILCSVSESFCAGAWSFENWEITLPSGARHNGGYSEHF